jgi:hypothetical protein
MKINKKVYVDFDEPPTIRNRSDALELLDLLLEAEGASGANYALEALRVALEREII